MSKNMDRSPRPAYLLLLALFLVPACAAIPPANVRATLEPGALAYDPLASPNRGSKKVFLALAFSGGGTRAAALAYGVLEELRATDVEIDGERRRLFDEIDVVTSVSGGSFASAYLGLHGEGIFDGFEDAVLYRDLEQALIWRLVNPFNWGRLNDRSHLVSQYYDKAIFHGATIGDFRADAPRIVVSATDLTSGERFAFVPEFFEAICSDLSSYPVSKAVTASSAVPGAFSPIPLRNFSAEGCRRPEPEWIGRVLAESESITQDSRAAKNFASYYRGTPRNYVHLVDGGLAGNLGVRIVLLRETEFGGFDAMWRQLDFADAEQVLMIVVNAETWIDPKTDLRAEAPSAMEVLGTTSTIMVNRQNRDSMQWIEEKLDSWRQQLTEQRRNVTIRSTEVNFSNLTDPDERAYFHQIATSLSLEAEEVNRLREIGRKLLREQPPYQSFVEDLGGQVLSP